ncbi:5-formyltetrahydrofolate cyclo-ligase [Sporolactobacillus sp. CQH2019]|uniref:5-formyltetrahydrofolate cyclo-ligase n=1 Tax=Sporolactobacillus sp. CQH2019 TaxID=3023512 RepID=UPI0023682002|nr:5-formyltetrahydrofolate cyclo-ligase [Sporolactobacillus sp. CQH2019]MDD9150771.1 5-formyltetrahydrofolate cyclo-ligase [Sporolactobacillus sp. CQH2019]
MKVTKKELRRQVLHSLQKIDERLFHEKCLEVGERLFACRPWRRAKTVAVTLSVGREIETKAIILKAWSQKKCVAVPKCEPSAKQLTFYRLESFDQLKIGYFGLMEPEPGKAIKMDKKSLDLVIVPGVVFDRRGYRIGYGGGYYDRFLQNFSGETVSLLLEIQLFDRLPEEGHDQRVDMLITENECIRVKDRVVHENKDDESD